MVKEKTAIITGAASGIGASTAVALAHEGVKVVIFDINEEGAKLSESINKNKGQSIFCKGDVSNSADIKKAIELSINHFESIDILINNAAFQSINNFFDLSEKDWRRAIDVNLTGCFLFTQYAAKEMKKGGAIININSIHSEIPRLDKFHYDASKAGLLMLTKETALALAPYNIRVNGIAAGAVITPMNSDWLDEKEKVERKLAKIPLGRLSTTDDIVKAIKFLISSDYITGTTITVDGGKSLT